MATNFSTARARELGAELRRVRERTDLTGAALAFQLGWSPSKVCRIEGGQQPTTQADATIYLARCRAPREELERLVELAGDTADRYRLQGHGERLPDELRSLIALETTADGIADYEPSVVPGLLQTEGYIRALLSWGGRPPGEGFELRVQARLARQRILDRRWSPELAFFVHEHALRAVVGGPQVMHEQLLHLTFAGGRSRCRIRVVEASAAPVAVFGTGFRLMRFAGPSPVAMVETHTATLFLERPSEIDVYQRLLTDVAATALNEGQSREWLASLASEYDRVECGSGGQLHRIELA